jgi:membrane protein
MPKHLFSKLVRIVTGTDAGGSLVEAEISRLEKFVHFWVLVTRSFIRNRCPIRASALSYSTLLALIPMLAVAMSVTSSLLKSEGEEQIYRFVDKLVAGVIPPAMLNTNTPAAGGDLFADELAMAGPAVTDLAATVAAGDPSAPAVSDTRVLVAQKEAARWIHDFIQNTRSGTLGITGMILLVFVAISMLIRLEETFNDIWGVTRGRNWFARVVEYWAAISLGPLLLVCALGLASGPHFETTRGVIRDMPVIGGFIFKWLPLVVVCLTFALLYQLVPNTRVQFRAALVGGVLAGSLWYANNLVGFLYVSRVVSYSKIYGSLGLVPVFMVGLYLSWFILLFGAQVAYAFQNRAAYLQEKIAENVNQRGREFVALRLMTCIGQRFHHSRSPATVPEMAAELGVPSKLVQQVLRPLLAAGLVVEISRAEPAYAPARPLDTINAHHVLMALRATAGQELVTRDEPVRAEVLGEFARIQEAEKNAASTITILALVNRTQARQLTPPPANAAPAGKT